MTFYKIISNFQFENNSISNSTNFNTGQNRDYSDLVHDVVTRFIRPQFLIFGIIGNILNLIVLLKHKSKRTLSALELLEAMSLMDLILLFVQSIYIVLEWLKSSSLTLATIETYYRCYLR